jgi:hypothetical protein
MKIESRHACCSPHWRNACGAMTCQSEFLSPQERSQLLRVAKCSCNFLTKGWRLRARTTDCSICLIPSKRKSSACIFRSAESLRCNTFRRPAAPWILHFRRLDLFVIPTIGFDLLYAFVIVRLDRKVLVWINITANPTETPRTHDASSPTPIGVLFFATAAQHKSEGQR